MTPERPPLRIDDPALPAAVHLHGEAAREVIGALSGAVPGPPVLLETAVEPGRFASSVHAVELEWPGGEVTRDIVVLAASAGDPPPGRVARIPVEGGPLFAWRFPHDPWLPGLPVARAPGYFDVGGRGADTTLLVYRGGRRAVLRLEVEGAPIAAVKIVPPRRVRALARVAAATVDSALVPAVVGYDAVNGIVASAWAPGVTLWRALLGGRPVPEPALLLDTVAAAVPEAVGGLPGPLPAAEAASRSIGRLAVLAPGHVPLATRVRDALAAAEPRWPRGRVHGDLHEGQVLVDADGRITAVIDLDRAGVGSVVHDPAMIAGRLLSRAEDLADDPRAAAFTEFAEAMLAEAVARVGAPALWTAIAGVLLDEAVMRLLGGDVAGCGISLGRAGEALERA